MRKILDITILINDIWEVKSESKTVKMINFSGKCTGEYFNGEILSGGVDTQVIEKDGTGTLSARYMLKGNDYTNTPCSIYIENTAVMGSEITSPKIVTDSTELKWLEKADLQGKLVSENKVLHIHIYEKK